MRFASDIWLWGVFASLGLAAILVAQGFRSARARARFGEEERVLALMTEKTGIRRAVRGVLSALAVALAFVAAAQPQYGKGTRVLPATNLDVVLVLDYSKSMYARDVSPSRISRAKVEVGKLVRELGGARFGAVAFAGESIAFPLTSDGGAIAQFFRGLEPNDLPIGGTAIARALESGRTLFERDPLSKNHERVMILITDGEDLEGDPVAVARTAAASGVRVEVVQIGGQSPEPIPVVDETGAVRGMRKDAAGRLLTTQLSAEGEAQLASVASEGQGQVVRAADGDVGIGEMTLRLRRLMTEELSERVETVYADVFHYPLALAVLLLMLEVGVGMAKKRVISPEPPRETSRRRTSRRARLSSSLLLLLLTSLTGCASVDRIFERESPTVNDAIEALQSSSPDQATEILIKYLETGACEEGVIGAGAKARSRADASYDLALAFGALSRKDEKKKAPEPSLLGSPPGGGVPVPGVPGSPIPGAGASGAAPSEIDPAIGHQIDCAIRLLAPIFEDRTKAVRLRARAHYLAGNLELLRQQYEAAVTSYDSAILLAPGVPEGEGDALGISIAYNRALAQRLLQEKQEQEKENEDGEKDDSEENEDGEKDDSEENEDGEKDDSEENEDGEKDDSEENEDGEKDDSEENEDGEKSEDEKEQSTESDEKDEKESDSDSKDEKEQPPSPQKSQQAENQESQEASRDERMLDLLEQAPTLQQHDAQKRKGQIRGRMTMEDK